MLTVHIHQPLAGDEPQPDEKRHVWVFEKMGRTLQGVEVSLL